MPRKSKGKIRKLLRGDIVDSRVYWVALSRALGIGSKRFLQLVDFFGSPREVWTAREKDLQRVPDMPRDIVEKLLQERKTIDPMKDWELLHKKGIGVILLEDKLYPQNLKTVFNPPATLYYRGTLRAEDQLSLAVVGARKPSPYGVLAAESLARGLVEANVCVVSGMARGIDTAAHRGALNGGGRTIAVLGTGVDVVFPRENRRLMDEIISNGAVISEFTPEAAGEAWHFPARNRIISGFSLGTLVVEAGEKSGSMITVDFALEQGREVFAVPGNINNPMSRGPHKLIKQGAKLVERVEDLLEELGIQSLFPEPRAKKKITLSYDEDKVCKLVSMEPVHLEELINRSGFASGQVSALLVVLELKGLVRQLPGKYYVSGSL